jgi:hypothetical protein
MGLLDLLPTSNLGLDGITPGIIPSAKKGSTMHYESSINDIPKLPSSSKLKPSVLDLNGKPPTLSSVLKSTQKLPYILNLPL